MEQYRMQINVCCSAGCKASGGAAIVEQFNTLLAEKGLQNEVQVVEASCFGMCAKGPVIKVMPEGLFYIQVKATDVARIVDEHIIGGKPVDELLYKVDPLRNYGMLLHKGAALLRQPGQLPTPGVKNVVLTGTVNTPGAYDLPKGTTLRDLINTYGGGIVGGAEFKCALSSGPMGGIMVASDLDTAVETLPIGTGGIVVMDVNSCVCDMARTLLEYTAEATCGKCTPCRVGNTRMLMIVRQLTQGTATTADIDNLQRYAITAKDASFCGFGQSSANPILGMLQHFRSEFVAHTERRCPAAVCKALISYTIDADKCVGCGLCAKKCPAEAISRTEYIAPGHKLASMHIDQDKCLKCGTCYATCRMKAISK